MRREDEKTVLSSQFSGEPRRTLAMGAFIEKHGTAEAGRTAAEHAEKIGNRQEHEGTPGKSYWLLA